MSWPDATWTYPWSGPPSRIGMHSLIGSTRPQLIGTEQTGAPADRRFRPSAVRKLRTHFYAAAVSAPVRWTIAGSGSRALISLIADGESGRGGPNRHRVDRGRARRSASRSGGDCRVGNQGQPTWGQPAWGQPTGGSTQGQPGRPRVLVRLPRPGCAGVKVDPRPPGRPRAGPARLTRGWGRGGGGHAPRQPGEAAARSRRHVRPGRPKYDLTNDVLSSARPRGASRSPGRSMRARREKVLDLAAGTGDSSARSRRPGAQVVPCDFSLGMLAVGKKPPRDAVRRRRRPSCPSRTTCSTP